MNRRTLPLMALAATLLAAGYAFGQGKSKTAPAPAPAAAQPQQQKLLRIASLNTIEANREFQANVQLVQTQRQAVAELNAAIEKEKDAKRKADLKTQLEQVTAKLNENNAAMQKAYAINPNRNYTVVVEKAHIFMFVTEEEAAKIEQAQKQEEQKNAKTKSGKK